MNQANTLNASLFLSNWSDILGSSESTYMDYDSLINSDDEFLCLESLFIDSEDFEASL